MSTINPEKIADILAECAELYVMPRYKALEEHEISTKTGPEDLVTQADIDVEAHLERVLPDLLPGSVVIGEEGVSNGSKSLDVLQDDTQKIWIIDPVDGTHNFVHQKREFAIMLALVIDGRTEYSWIYDVLAKTCAITERGSGAFYGDERLQVSTGNKGPSDYIGHLNSRFLSKVHQGRLEEVIGQFKSIGSLRCAGHEYLRLARGQSDFILYKKLKPWDHLPGALMVEEAGGVVAQWDRAPYTPRTGDTGLIIANNQDIWEHVQRELIENLSQ